MILVLGASGFIGRHIYAGLNRRGVAVRGTYCRKPSPGLIHFDLQDSCFDVLLDRHDIGAVVIASGRHVTIDAAKVHWEDAYSINVARTKAFIFDANLVSNTTPNLLLNDRDNSGRQGVAVAKI